MEEATVGQLVLLTGSGRRFTKFPVGDFAICGSNDCRNNSCFQVSCNHHRAQDKTETEYTKNSSFVHFCQTTCLFQIKKCLHSRNKLPVVPKKLWTWTTIYFVSYLTYNITDSIGSENQFQAYKHLVDLAAKGRICVLLDPLERELLA